MKRPRLAPRYSAAVVLIGILTITGIVDAQARSRHEVDVRAEVSEKIDALAQDLDDVVARESSGVDTLAAFVEITANDPEHLDREFYDFADALIRDAETVRSVQLAPGGKLLFVHPVEGNEAAVGLDLFADPDRRALLAPAVESGETVVQGPVELVQGGYGIIVRRPVYQHDGSFWGFTAVVLDWPAVAMLTQIDDMDRGYVAGARIADIGLLAAGDLEAFEGDPERTSIRLGMSDTVWEIAARPEAGWPRTAPATPLIWVLGTIMAMLSAYSVYQLLKRPETLHREREQVRSELAFAEARYRATFQNAAVGVAMTDTAGKILSANPALHRIFRVPDGFELKGTMASDHVNAEDLTMVRNAARRLVAGEKAVEFELRSAGKAERWLKVVASRIEGSRNDRLFVAVVEDITTRRESERVLAESEARFRQLFENAPIAIQREDYTEAEKLFARLRADGVTDLQDYLIGDDDRIRAILEKVRIVDANPAATALQGHLERRKGADTTLLDRSSEPALRSFVESLVAIWEGRTSLEHSVQTVAADGSPLYLDVRWSAPTVAGKPDYSRLMVTIADITELRMAQERLRDLVESKDRFIASVAHELRTPLTAVLGFAHELKDDLQLYGDQEKDEFRELIAFHSDELSHIIEDLLVWARGDIGEVTVRTESMDLGAGVRRSLSSVSGVELAVDEPDGPVEVVADPGRLRQIVRNLATNAVRYGGEDVAVAVRHQNGRALIDVSDDGPALDEADLERIFEPYARSEHSSTMPGSIGLGLSVSRTLARLQGGDLVCVRENGRNVFRVSFPTAPADQDSFFGAVPSKSAR